MNLEELLKREQQIQTQMSELLIQIRLANNIDSSFKVSRELNMSPAALRNIEKGISFPTERTLKQLINFYVLTPNERVTVAKLKEEMLRIRKKMKEIRKGE